MAAYAKVSPWTVRRAAAKGELESRRLHGDHGQRRYKPEWAKRWLGLLFWLTMIGLSCSAHPGRSLLDSLADALF